MATHSKDMSERRIHVESWPDDTIISATEPICFGQDVRDIPFCDEDVDLLEATAKEAYAEGEAEWPEGFEVGPLDMAIIQLRWVATVWRMQAKIAELGVGECKTGSLGSA